MLVSVVMITYGHEKFIKHAIDGVLAQEVNFQVELLIVNDCSPDNTELIINLYNKHSKVNWINYTKHQINIGSMPNFIWALQRAKGKYIALCEGDDYWTDPSKLQKQVDFLEANEEYGMCGHRVRNLNDDIESNEPDINIEISTEAILEKGPLMATCSMLMRNNFTKEEYSFLYKSSLGDWAIVLIHSQKSKIKKLNEIMAVYRIHDGGVYSKNDIKDKIQKNIQFQLVIIEHFPQYKKIVEQFIDNKKNFYNLYDYSFISFLKGKTSFFVFLYGLRVKLNLRKRLLNLN